MKNKSKFDSLRRLITILSIILLIALDSKGQATRSSNPGPGITLNTYPNPATTYITFDLQKGFEKGLSIQVFSFLGRKMYESQSVAEKTTVDLSEYNRGVYILQLKDQSGRIIKSGKFQVSK